MEANPFHLAGKNDWATPVEVILAARDLMGSIGLDPASSLEANMLVRADQICTKEDDGLSQAWKAYSVFLNPPGELRLLDESTGKRKLVAGTKEYPKRFWEKLVKHYLRREVKTAFFVCFSLEQLQTFQGTEISPLKFPMCVPKSRLKFIGGGGSPTHANALVWLPPVEIPREIVRRKMEKAFRNLGEIVIP